MGAERLKGIRMSNMEKILRLASAVSALAVTQIGVGIADHKQLADMMASIEVARIR